MSVTTKTKYDGKKQEDAFKDGLKDRGFTLVGKIGINKEVIIRNDANKEERRYKKEDFKPTGKRGNYSIDFTDFDNNTATFDVVDPGIPRDPPPYKLKVQIKKPKSPTPPQSPKIDPNAPPAIVPPVVDPTAPPPAIVPPTPVNPTPVVPDKIVDTNDEKTQKLLETQNKIIKKLLAQQVSADELAEISSLSLTEIGNMLATQQEETIDDIETISEQQGDQTRQVISDQSDLIRDQIAELRDIYVLSKDEAEHKSKFKEGKSWLVDRLSQGDPVIENRLLGVNQDGNLEMEMIIKKLDEQNNITDGTKAIITIAKEEMDAAATQAERNQILKDVMEELVKEDARKGFKDKLLGKTQSKKLIEEPISKKAQFNYTNQLQREIASRKPLYSYY